MSGELTRPPRIVVVDDHDPTRYATVRILRAAGFEIFEATDGTEGLRLATSGVDLVVLDINLPDIDGFQVCRELRSRPDTADLPVVHLSATFVEAADQAIGMKAGADSYLTHPVDPVTLVATVRALLFARAAQAGKRAADARLKTLFDKSPVGMAMLRHDLHLVDANPAFGRLLGADPADLTGRGIASLVDEDEAATLSGLGESVAQTGGWQGILRRTRGGRTAHLEWTLWRDPGNELLFASVSDVTERRLSETRQLRSLDSERAARAEAELSNQLKDEFLATLSHELRNPLGAILGWAGVLKHVPGLPPTMTQAVDAIDRNARIQSHLISDLLDFAGIRFGKMRLEPRLLDATSLVRSAIDTVAHQAREKQLDLRLESEPGESWIEGDEARLQQVIWNLLSNAIKFTPPGGAVVVHAGAVGSEFRISVTDSGPGIAPEFLPRIFDRFSQQDSTKSKNFAGLGIGLTIVRHLVEVHGGRIEASSPGLGLGATFKVTLPLTSAGSTADRGARLPGASDLRGLHVLVVEDGEDTRALVVRLLSDAGARVTDVGSADEAIARIGEARPDVLISDIGMARTDGYSLLRALRSAGHSPDALPAIALTAFMRDEDRTDALEAGFQVHLGKPVNAGALIGAVAMLAGRVAQD